MINNYKNLCTEFYDLDKPTAPEDALEFYTNEILGHTQPVLEPMCGSGRFLIPLLQKGIEIEGSDASAEMLDECRKKSAAVLLRPVLHYGLLQELELPAKFGLAIIPSGSIGLITGPGELKRSLENLFKCLLPCGELILEVLTTGSITCGKITEEREVKRTDGTKITLKTESQCDPFTSVETTRCEYSSILNGEVSSSETEVITLKYYDAAEFTAVLNRSGFENIRVLKPYTDLTANYDDKHVIFKCSKPQ